jgi:hypothetical protein
VSSSSPHAVTTTNALRVKKHKLDGNRSFMGAQRSSPHPDRRCVKLSQVDRRAAPLARLVPDFSR